ncbi:uncharacterized protein LOC119457493 isoform X2 [Dermacentor silvarum]|uniref:uncharacterized protein LOC119457493 isoform X2 n=1 Tax=Dermacentor silvarum TaxID=543639 RepID=UPI00210178A9|nr:uncharacterized protein LOC119457493 isoform X2 [Dermacentor silvarum]
MQHRPSCRLDGCPHDVVAVLLLLLLAVEVTPAAYIHQACDSDADCATVANTFCKGNECICLPKFSRSYPPCNQGIELGESCSRHENCEVNDNNSYCHHSICRCKPLFRRVLLVSENVTRCRRGRYLDETCARDSDCDSLVNNSYCSSDHCECKSGYIREGAVPDEQHCEIDRGGRGALKILFALMLPVVVCAFVYLYRNRKVNQANKNQSGEEEQQSASSPAPQGTYSTDTGVKSPSVNTPLSPMPPDIITGSPIQVRTTLAAATRGRPPCTFSIMV